MDREQRDAIKTKFLELREHPAMDNPGVLSMLLESIINETEADRLKREQVAKEKADILRMEQLPAPIVNAGGRVGNPLGYNQRQRDPKRIVCMPFATHDEHDAFMMKLVHLLHELEAMGANDQTNQKNWHLEGEEVGKFARRMRNELFPVQEAIPRKPKPAEDPNALPPMAMQAHPRRTVLPAPEGD